jgi:TfoX/Sxy family transcriptional regulator of competence genes
MPKADAATKEFFLSILPKDPRVTVRPMFGHQAAFANGYMFAGIFGTRVFVRLPDPERAQLLAVTGATEFSPMEGRPMREYAVMPGEWHNSPAKASEWVSRALDWASQLPPKEKKKKKAGP